MDGNSPGHRSVYKRRVCSTPSYCHSRVDHVHILVNEHWTQYVYTSLWMNIGHNMFTNLEPCWMAILQEDSYRNFMGDKWTRSLNVRQCSSCFLTVNTGIMWFWFQYAFNGHWSHTWMYYWIIKVCCSKTVCLFVPPFIALPYTQVVSWEKTPMCLGGWSLFYTLDAFHNLRCVSQP